MSHPQNARGLPSLTILVRQRSASFASKIPPFHEDLTSRLDDRMFRVPLGRLLVRVTDAAYRRFAQPATHELHAQRQAARRKTAGHRQGGAAAEVERLGVNVVPHLLAPRFVGLFV